MNGKSIAFTENFKLHLDRDHLIANGKNQKKTKRKKMAVKIKRRKRQASRPA